MLLLGAHVVAVAERQSWVLLRMGCSEPDQCGRWWAGKAIDVGRSASGGSKKRAAALAATTVSALRVGSGDRSATALLSVCGRSRGRL